MDGATNPTSGSLNSGGWGGILYKNFLYQAAYPDNLDRGGVESGPGGERDDSDANEAIAPFTIQTAVSPGDNADDLQLSWRHGAIKGPLKRTAEEIS